MQQEVLFTIVHNNLRYTVSTDHLCECKLWIKVYDGDNMLCNVFMWLLDKDNKILDTIYYDNGDRHFPSWKECIGFRWKHVEDNNPIIFSKEAQKKLDSYFKLKAFW